MNPFRQGLYAKAKTQLDTIARMRAKKGIEPAEISTLSNGMEPAKVSKLPNGITLVTCKQPSHQTYLELNVSVGSRHEGPGQGGLPHFLEHMLARTTDSGEQSYDEKVREMYGKYNAYTSSLESA